MSYAITKEELEQRAGLVAHIRKVIMAVLKVEECDDSSLIISYSGFHLQIAFSDMHPLMMFHFVCKIYNEPTQKHHQMVEEYNLKSVLGCHMIDDEAECYAYRATHWLDTELDKQRFLEILERCTDEAIRCYTQLMKS